MAVSVSVRYNGGFLPDMVDLLLTQCYDHWRIGLNAMKVFCLCSSCSEGLDAFRYFFKQLRSVVCQMSK